MTTISNVPSTFMKSITLGIQTESNQSFTLQAFKSDGQPMYTHEWLPFLFFHYEATFYGLTANHSEEYVTLTPLEMVELFSEKEQHPFVQYEGIDMASAKWLAAANEASSFWYSPRLWDSISLDEEEEKLELKVPLDETATNLLENALMQKMVEAGLRFTDLPPLLPFFRNGGWPITTKNVHDEIFVALRLREPEELSEDWVLETVIRGKKSATYWAPPMRKRALKIENALPDKWKQHADGIEKLQGQMSSLLHMHDYMDNADTSLFLSLTLSDADVRQFLRADFIRLQALGFEIILPAWLKDIKDSRVKVRASASTASNYKSAAGLQEILTFNWKLSLNGQELTMEQFQQMVNDNREFIRAGTEWVRVDAAWMQEIRKLMDKAENENWTVRDLLFQELPEELVVPVEEDEDDSADDPFFQFEIQKSLKDYVKKLQDKKGLPSVPVSDKLHASLRPYQQEGYDWLTFMREQQFGACLADDMGLGKTVQLISYLCHVYEEEKPPTLIICPTSVLGNWQKELERFAPSLEVYLHYGAGRLKEDSLVSYLKEQSPQVVLTTYGTVTQDADSLEKLNWACIALDEAQNIKNMQTKQSRAIRKLHGEHHIALTGTPVENRLSELWAIFDFIYKGYLGSIRRFQEDYIAPIERDDSEAHKQKLRKKIQPFLLRRTKQDPALMLNLPDKLEQLEYCPLTQEQAVLYESFIQETMHKLETLTGFERKGLILKMLSKLKQLCNHPALYLKEPFDNAADMLPRSEKLDRLVTLGSEIASNNEQCLIFTQYIGMGHLLQHCFSELYDIDVPFLTGSMPKQQRDHFVESFQKGEFPIFILSLKAGGTGLNLTAANHVLHADRWWNPAVENQATDRAYRIGQTQFVHVHKFITTGTIEEKIDTLLTEKQALSEDLIQSSQWITELKDEEILDLLSFNFN
ncbi:DEAD/DEAH box helicase [Viridibacillus arvi]|uniref:DEAD/DEAH box helicase n=1 Tax=Viridibacillus arvi TaxID=263475 RepID=UPI000AA1D2D9|nr:DEAD/DEAH box helicase [Viridibacillus arvi]